MSERSLAAKLLVKPGDLVWVSDPGGAPCWGRCPTARASRAAAGSTRRRGSLSCSSTTRRPPGAAFDADAAALMAVPVVWVLYPKANRADVNRDSLWRLIAPYGLRPITNVAVDETWSALRFRPLRPDEPPFTGGG